MNKTHINEFVVSRSFKSSPDLRPSFCREFEYTFSCCGTWSTDIWKLFGHTESTNLQLQVISSNVQVLVFLGGSKSHPHKRSSLHQGATLENSTLRHFDLNLQLQVSPHMLFDSSFDCLLWVFSRPFDALELCAVEELATVFETRFKSWLCHNYFFSCSFLYPFRHFLRATGRAEIAEVEQTKKMVSLIRYEVVFFQYVSELVFGVHVFDLDLGVLVDSVKKPIKRNSVGSGHVSHRWTSAFDDHLDHRFVMFKNIKQGARTRRFHVTGNIFDIR